MIATTLRRLSGTALSCALSAACLWACEPAAEDSAPSAFNLQIQDQTIVVGIAVGMSGSLGVSDPDGNLQTLHLAMRRADGSAFASLDTPINGAAGQTEGTLPFAFDLTADAPGRYTLEAWVTDADGQDSNHVVASTSEAVDASTTPSLTNLHVVVGDGGDVQTGISTTASGTVDYMDGDADLTTLVVTVRAFAGAVVAEVRVPVADPATSGTAPFSIEFVADATGSHSIEVVGEDAGGHVSRALTASFSAVQSPTAPQIKNVDLAGKYAYVDIPSTLPVSFDFTDSDANLATLHVRIDEPSGTTVLEREVALDVAGETSGSLTVPVTFTATSAQRYSLSAWLADAAGERSNTFKTTFDAIVASTTAPSLSGLQLQIGTVYAGKPASLAGTIAFADVDGNASTVIVRVLRPDGATLAQAVTNPSELSGQTSGRVPFALDFTAETVALHQLEIQLEDGDGQPSAPVRQTIDAKLSPSAPKLADLDIHNTNAYLAIPVVIPVDFGFQDSDANVSTLHVRVLSPSGAVAYQAALPLPQAAGQTSGSVSTEVVFEAALAGRHTFEGWLADAQGETSNHATLSFDATAPSTTAPSVSSLVVDVGNVLAGRPATLSGSIHYADVDSNVTRLVLRLARPDGSALVQTETAVTPGSASGTLTFDLAFTPDAIALHTLRVWVVDEDGQPSTQATRSIDALESPTAPRLTNLDVGGRAYVDIPSPLPLEITFSDSDGNVDKLHVRITSPAGSVVLEQSMAVPSALGLGTGTTGVTLSFTAPAAGRHTLEAWLEDQAGERSRPASRTFDALVASTTAPNVSALVTSAPTLYPNAPASVTGTLDWSDVDANVATLVVRFKELAGAVVAEQRSPITSTATSGQAAFTLAVTPARIALHELEAWVEDADGQPSRHVTKTLDVIRSPTAPVASNLSLPGAHAWVGISSPLPLSLSFTDSDKDLATLDARILSPSGSVVLVHSQGVPSASGLASGTVSAEVPFTALVAGRYTIKVWLTDAAGQASQELQLTFDASVPATTAPRAYGLEVMADDAVAAKPSTLDGLVRFEDIDGNVTTLVARLLRPSGTLLKEQRTTLTGLGTSGEVSFTLAFTPDVVGYHTLELWLEDGDGQASTRLTRGLSVIASPSAPALAGLDLGTSKALVAVASTLAGDVDFTDSDANIATLHLRFTSPSGAVVSETTKNVSALAGQSQGQITFSQSITATVAGRHTLALWLVDALGETSAVVTRTFDALTTSTTPSVTSLTVEAPPIYLRTTAAVSGSVTFADVDMNVTTLFLKVTRPSGTTLVERQDATSVAGQASGLITFSVDVTADVPGAHKLEVWLQDAAGQSASKQSKTLDVIDTRPIVKKLSVVHEPLFVTKTSTLSGTVELTDADGNPSAVKLQLVRPDGTAWPVTTVTLADDLTLATVPFAFEVTPDVKGSHSLHAWVEDDDGQASAHVTQPVVVGDTTQVQSACAALGTDCTGLGLCYDVKASTCDYFEDHQLSPPVACDTIATTVTAAMCVSSTTDPISPLLSATNRCKFVQYWSYPTDEPIDCRCPEARFDQRCRRPYESPQALSFGTGPRIRTLAGTFQAWRGLVVGREWLLPVKWSTSSRPYETMIFGVDLDTGNRRHFSGAWDSPANGYTQVGSGDAFTQVMDIKLGPDGQLYAVGASSDIAAPKLWRIDLQTGNRTKIFDEATASEAELCPNFSSLPGRKTVQMAAQGWTMDSQGRFYFSNVGMPGPSILRLTVAGVGGASATSCQYLTRIMDCPTCTTQQNVGGGYDTIQFDMTAFEIVGPKLYAVSDKRFLSVDLTTGSRSMLSFASDIGAIGTGPINGEGLADRWTTWDATREVFWTSGILGGSMAVTVDPATGDRAAWPCFHDTRGVLEACGGTGMALVPGLLNFGGMVIDPLPPHDLFFAHDLMSVVKYDVRTGNSYVLSL